MSNSTEELKPCPFCGGEVGMLYRPIDSNDFLAQCGNPKCGTRVHGESRQSATNRWNTRADDWQPIENAPMDGAPIDLFAGGKRIPDAIWDGCRWVRWVVAQGWKEVFNPTHFRHLPQSPKEEG